MSLSFLFKKMSLLVVYYDQHLGAGHSKRWLKQSFTAFFMAKSCKKDKESKKFEAKFSKISKKFSVWVLSTTRWLSVLQVFERKSCFFGNKTLHQCSGAQHPNAKFCCKFLAFFSFLQLFVMKMLLSLSLSLSLFPLFYLAVFFSLFYSKNVSLSLSFCCSVCLSVNPSLSHLILLKNVSASLSPFLSLSLFSEK